MPKDRKHCGRHRRRIPYMPDLSGQSDCEPTFSNIQGQN